MKRIQALIVLLLAMNPLEVKKDKNFFENLLEKMRKQNVIIDKLRIAARKEATLLGRTITFPGGGDGKCVYLITKVYPKTVQIDWLNYCDGWSDARAGHQALLDIEYAKAFVNFEDNWGTTLPKVKIICPTITASPERLKEFQS